MDKSSFSIKKSSLDESRALAYEKFLTQGENLLLKGDFLGLKFCDLAEKLQPESSDLLYRIGLALSEFGQTKLDRSLILLACKKFRQVLKKDPLHFSASQALGSNLFFLGKEFNEYHFFLIARKVYDNMLLHLDLMPEDLQVEILSDTAAILLEIGRKEQDHIEFQQSLKLLHKAAELKGSRGPEFWILFGHLYFEYGDLSNNAQMFLKSVEMYKKALALSPKNTEAWFHLGLSLKHIYLLSHDEDHFIKANECFSNSASLNPFDYDSWIEWAHLLLESGKSIKDTKRLISAIEKCQKASNITTKESIHQTIWSEALLNKGLIEENINDLYIAEQKLVKLLEDDSSNTDVYICSGLILNGFAQYFEDIDFHYQAIEKFQEGLKIDKKSDLLWFLLAETFSLTGYLTEDKKMIEKSFFFYQKAIHYKKAAEYYFSFAKSYLRFSELTSQKQYINLSLYYFELAFQKHSNVVYTRPDWLFEYALALDSLGDKTEEPSYYLKAIEILNHVLIIDPQFKDIHYKLGVIYSHLAELDTENPNYAKSLFHFQIASKNEPENDTLLMDMALTLTNYAETLLDDESKRIQLIKESEFKLMQSAKLGNIHAYYHLGGIYALQNDLEKAMNFIFKANRLGSLPDMSDLLQDAWLENLKGYHIFETFLQSLEKSSKL